MRRRLRQLFTVVCAAAVLLTLSATATQVPSGSRTHLIAKAPASAEPCFKSFDSPDVTAQTLGVVLPPPSALGRLTLLSKGHAAKSVPKSLQKNRAPPALMA